MTPLRPVLDDRHRNRAHLDRLCAHYASGVRVGALVARPVLSLDERLTGLGAYTLWRDAQPAHTFS